MEKAGEAQDLGSKRDVGGERPEETPSRARGSAGLRRALWITTGLVGSMGLPVAFTGGTMEAVVPPVAGAPAIRCAGHERDYPSFLDRAARIATGLRAAGVGPGDRIAVVMRNEPAHLEITAGAALLGASAVPVNWHFRQDDLRHVLTDSGSKVVFAHSDMLDAVTAVLPDGVRIVEAALPAGVAAACKIAVPPVTGEHPLLDRWLEGFAPLDQAAGERPPTVIYSSGTTGLPKGVLREPVAPDQLEEGVRLFLERFAVAPGGRTLIPAPLYHASPSQHAVLALAAGLDITLMPRFDAEEFLRLIARHRIEQVQVVPTMFVRLLRLPKDVRERYDLSSLTSVVHAAAPCPPHIKYAMIDWLGPVLREYYGGSETGAVTWCDSAEWLAHPGTVGRATGTCEVAVIGPGKEPLPAGATGDIYLKPGDGWPRSPTSATPAGAPPWKYRACPDTSPSETSAISTRTAISSSATGGTTWSSRAASTSTPRRSKAACSPSTGSVTRRSSVSPMRSSAKSSRPICRPNPVCCSAPRRYAPMSPRGLPGTRCPGPWSSRSCCRGTSRESSSRGSCGTRTGRSTTARSEPRARPSLRHDETQSSLFSGSASVVQAKGPCLPWCRSVAPLAISRSTTVCGSSGPVRTSRWTRFLTTLGSVTS